MRMQLCASGRTASQTTIHTNFAYFVLLDFFLTSGAALLRSTLSRWEALRRFDVLCISICLRLSVCLPLALTLQCADGLGAMLLLGETAPAWYTSMAFGGLLLTRTVAITIHATRRSTRLTVSAPVAVRIATRVIRP